MMTENLHSKRLKIILTDDDEDDREMFSFVMGETGIPHNLKTFSNGLALLSYLQQDDCDFPDIIFLDLNMPVLDGIAALHKIRALEKCRQLPPIVIYSTSNNMVDIQKTFNSGANLYITKPNNFQSLKKVLQEVLTQYKSIMKLPVQFEDYCFQL